MHFSSVFTNYKQTSYFIYSTHTHTALTLNIHHYIDCYATQVLTYLHAHWAVIPRCLFSTDMLVPHGEAETVATRITVKEILPSPDSGRPRTSVALIGVHIYTDWSGA